MGDIVHYIQYTYRRVTGKNAEASKGEEHNETLLSNLSVLWLVLNLDLVTIIC